MWGPAAKFFTASATVLTLIAFLNPPLLNLISTTWQGIPWWAGLVALIPLLFYALVRASYEEYRAATEPHAGSGAAVLAPQWPPSRELEQLEEQVLPQIQQQDGYRGFIALGDRQSGKMLSVTLWESEQAMRASEEAANRLRDESTEAVGGAVAGVERYEVRLFDVPS